MYRRLALLAAVPLAMLAAAAAPATAAPAQEIFIDYGDLESRPSSSVIVLIGANDYGIVSRPG